MKSKALPYEQLTEAIRVGFDKDQVILQLYDPGEPLRDLEQVPGKILAKLNEMDLPKSSFGVYHEGKLIGYFVKGKNQVGNVLISFALNIRYRKMPFKKQFFDVIAREMKGKFHCFLWSRNVRAVRYLMKHGMTIAQSDPVVTTLIKT